MSAQATTFIQWKNTEACLDFGCSCGFSGHVDAMFANHIKCPECGAVWEQPHTLVLHRVAGDARPVVTAERDVD